MLHSFLLNPGVWDGQGKISFSFSEDAFDFTMRWTVQPEQKEEILFHQTIEIEELSQQMRNNFSASNVSEDGFVILLRNETIGAIKGRGVIDPKVIAWEFRDPGQGFEGFEVYALQEDGGYKMRAEFTGGDGLRTFVKGTIQQINHG
ncbi:MAG: hypothetical protein S4CHLAM45_01000 [Chlamydiales bacterium]|nr:hypothetical protein [Chlamydiales bacterium]MCH9619421.1 hypothetical protein [Chlamydiales bacterium]MCH9622225.1 hypothetical protein [Chlamydiales bacterium]